MNKEKCEKPAPFDWESVRRNDGTVDLVMAWNKIFGRNPFHYQDEDEGTIQYLLAVEAIRPINSRQAAAIAIATATGMARK